MLKLQVTFTKRLSFKTTFKGHSIIMYSNHACAKDVINTQTQCQIWIYLRVAVCKDRESAVSDPFGESLIFCPKLALGTLFSKTIFKSSNGFVYLGNLRKIKSAVKMLSKCGFLVH